MDADGATVLDDSGKPIAGGNVFARPIGHFILADVLKLVGVQGKSIEDAINVIMTHIPMNIDKAPWVRVIWNPTTQRIIGSKSERALIASMISHALGLKINMKVRELKQKYRDTIEDSRANLIEPINWSGRQIHEDLDDDSEYISEG
ncbi:MAG: hypothetical protein PUP92_30135 [Rhizonema sp. PD38]|nr:hypothetical protein [Rhizonema sp. PD38]